MGGNDPANFWMNGLYAAVVILAVFPLVVAIGAGSKVVGRKSQKICKLLGDISYPLYITHYPLIYVQMGWALEHKDAPLDQQYYDQIVILNGVKNLKNSYFSLTDWLSPSGRRTLFLRFRSE